MPLCALRIAKFSRAKSNLRQIEFGVTDLIAILTRKLCYSKDDRAMRAI